MEEEKCSICERGKDETDLLDAVHLSELIKICPRCARVENIPLVRKPTQEQIEAGMKPSNYRERVRNFHKEDINTTLENIRKRQEEKNIQNKLVSSRYNSRPENLVDNFNWHIIMARKKIRISRKQLGEAIGESEETIRVLEDKMIPVNGLKVLEKIEQYLGVKLIKRENVTSLAGMKDVTLDDLRKIKEEKMNSEIIEEPVNKEFLGLEVEFSE